MSSYDETIKYKGYRISIEHDDDTENPYTDYDQTTDLVTWHRKYNFNSTRQPDYKQKPNAAGKYPMRSYAPYDSPQEVLEAVKSGELVWAAPLYAYEHGGITVNLGSMGNWPDQQWDCGLLGMVYVTKEKAKAEWPNYGGMVLQHVCHKRAESEVKTFDMYLTGQVYGYWIWKKGEGRTKHDGETCWGCYGYDYCLSEAKGVVDQLVEEEARLAAEAKAWEERIREDYFIYSCAT